MTSEQLRTGTCKCYDAVKGFGFIRLDGPCEEGSKGDLFVHRSDICDRVVSLDSGERLQFRIAQNPVNGRFKAIEVRSAVLHGGAVGAIDPMDLGDESLDELFDECFPGISVSRDADYQGLF